MMYTFPWLAFFLGLGAGACLTGALVLLSVQRQTMAAFLRMIASVCLVLPFIFLSLAIGSIGTPTRELIAVPVGMIVFAALSKAAQAVEPLEEVAAS